MNLLGLAIALLFIASAATSDGEATTRGNDASLPLTYRARVITTIGPVCPPDRAIKQLQDEITQDIQDQIFDSIVRGPNKKSKNEQTRLKYAEIQEPSDLVCKL